MYQATQVIGVIDVRREVAAVTLFGECSHMIRTALYKSLQPIESVGVLEEYEKRCPASTH
ncbi:hypothetical protein E2C01_027780 [Portunus trituberculatus]|uniref:Uncharacterized protein n=1 Tax=Portunus trituberculatus TaxID=210409 RepID=A0A5B7EN37_PORTR|nr:hypothetical protein [Portunus trituberculatus]